MNKNLDFNFNQKCNLLLMIFAILINAGSYAQSDKTTECAQYIISKDYKSAANLLQTNSNVDIKLTLDKVYSGLQQNKAAYYEQLKKLLNVLTSSRVKLNILKQLDQEFDTRLPQSFWVLTYLYGLFVGASESSCERYESYTLKQSLKKKLVSFSSTLLMSPDKNIKPWFTSIYNTNLEIAKNIVEDCLVKMFDKNSSSLDNTLNKINDFKEPEVQLLGYQILLEMMYDRKDNERDSMFVYTKNLKQFFEKKHKTLPKHLKDEFIVLINTLPDCPRSVIFTKENLCIENFEYVLNANYQQITYPTWYYLIEGRCSTQITSRTSWKYNNVTGTLTPYNAVFTQNNVKFEIANENGCYIKMDGKYLTKKKNEQYIELISEKTPAGVWHVTTIGG